MKEKNEATFKEHAGGSILFALIAWAAFSFNTAIIVFVILLSLWLFRPKKSLEYLPDQKTTAFDPDKPELKKSTPPQQSESALSIFGDIFKQPTSYESKQQIAKINCDLQGSNGYDFEVAAESHYKTNIWSLIPAEHSKQDNFRIYYIFTLEMEDNNPHDNLAVAVKLNKTIVGYVPREFNKKYRKFATERGLIPSGTCRGVIVGNKGKDYSIWLDIDNIE